MLWKLTPSPSFSPYASPRPKKAGAALRDMTAIPASTPRVQARALSAVCEVRLFANVCPGAVVGT